MKALEKFQAEAYALMWIVVGFMFSFHGVQKIFGVLTDHQPAIGSQIWFGGLIELIGGVMVMLGLKTRWAAFICSGTMAVAYIQFHWKMQMGTHLLPIVNKGEMALLYAFTFLFLATRGGVKWCLDKKG